MKYTAHVQQPVPFAVCQCIIRIPLLGQSDETSAAIAFFICLCIDVYIILAFFFQVAINSLFRL